MPCTTQNQIKKTQIETLFQQIDKKMICKTKEEATDRKLSNLILKSLQDDKKQIDCWDAFGRFSWDKSF